MSKCLSYNEVHEKALEWFNGDELAAEVWMNKYALKDEEGNFYESTPDDMFDRLADTFYNIEKTYPNPYSREEIRNMFSDSEHKIRVIPGGSVLAGMGDPDYIGSLSNCLVVDSPEDSYHGIMKSREERVQLMKRRCGVGVDISTLRPAGAIVNNPAKSSTGPVSFMDVDSGLTNEVAQSGRRGALMITISCLHPDVLDFIKKKQDLTKVTGANISVQLTNDFMEAVKNDTDFILRWPVDIHIRPEEYKDLEYGKLEVLEIQCGKVYVRRIKARDYWNELIHCAHRTGEPGIMFHDIHIDYSPEGKYEKYRGITTNPCGEIFMEKYDSCRLISLNLSSFVDNPFTSKAQFNYSEFEKAVRLGLHISDDLVDAEIKCIDRIIKNIDPKSNVELNLWKTIRETGKQGRRCGLGITALGDMVAMMNYKFDSDEAFEFIEKVMSTKYKAEVKTEIELAKERGVFYGFDPELEKTGPFSDRLKENVGEELWKEYVTNGRRNVSWSTIAPTGSLSILTQTTSGIEPIFSAYYTRRKKCVDGDRVDFVDKTGQKFIEYLVIHPQLKKWFKINGLEITKELGIDYLENMENYKLEDMDKIFKYSPWYMSTANDIDWKKRTALQGMIQKYITHSISSTVNLPNSATEKDVENIYMEAYDKCLKGITCYRDRCRDGVLISAKKECDCNNQTLTHNAPKRPKILKADVKRFKNNKEKWVACVGLFGDDKQPYEVFTGPLEKLNIPDYVDEGEIIKNKITMTVKDEYTGVESEKKVSRYDFRYIDKTGNKITIEGINIVFDQVLAAFGRLISGILRHGMPIEYLISTIKNISFPEETVNSWKAGIIRALGSYVKEKEVIGEVCPDCGGKLIFENGCRHCSSCGYSACG